MQYTPDDVFSNPSYPLRYYRFWVRALGANAAGAVHASHGEAAKLELVRDQVSGYDCATLLGEFSDGETDVFTLSGKADHALIGHVHAAGEHGQVSANDGAAGMSFERKCAGDSDCALGERFHETNRFELSGPHPEELGEA